MIDKRILISIAKVCHAANAAYCASIGDYTVCDSWEYLTKQQRESAVNGVKFNIKNPDATDADNHQSWLEQKERDGWVYGEVKDTGAKIHPCFLPFDSLPEEQKVKDRLFSSIVRALTSVL